MSELSKICDSVKAAGRSGMTMKMKHEVIKNRKYAGDIATKLQSKIEALN